MKKRVLLVIRWPVGGIRTFIRYVYRNFDHEAWQFTIVAPDLSEMRVLLEDDLAALDVRYAPVEKSPSFASFAITIAWELIRGKYDLVHSHGFTSGVCTALPAKLTHNRHMMTSHDVINQNQFLGVRGKVKMKVVGAMLGMVDIIHSVSHDAQNNLLEYFPNLSCSERKCVVINNGIEVERFRDASPHDFRDELGVGEDVFLIGFLGRFMSQKGFGFLVDAIDILRKETGLQKQFLVLTFGDGGFFREERQAVQDKGLSKFFRFMPFAPNVAGTIKGLDVVAMPSLWEACGLLAMEAMICGTPFIGTDCIGLREILQGTPAIMVPKADSVALAQALKQEMLVSHKNEFMAFQPCAEERFCVSRTSQAVMEIYEGLVAR